MCNGRLPPVRCAAAEEQSVAFVSRVSEVVTAAADVTETVPSPLVLVFVNAQQRFASALSFDVSNDRSTVPL
jgi:hypothetical protein